MNDIGCIILAAGKGTRMKSSLSKVMHKAAGRSLLGHVMSAVRGVDAKRLAVVVGPEMPEVQHEAQNYFANSIIVEQTERKGTGDAVAQAKDGFAGFSGMVLVLYGDVPLIATESLKALVDAASHAGGLAVLGFEAENPFGYGRLLTDRDNRLLAIREELDATDDERKIRLSNSGVIAIDNDLLWKLLPQISNDNAKQEYYLTDLIGLASKDGVKPAIHLCPEQEVLGVNDRAQLAVVEGFFQQRLRAQALAGGATMVDPATVFLSIDSKIGQDVVIEPNVVIGPNVVVGDHVTIKSFSHIEGAVLADGAQIGPYARLRPGADIGVRAKIGNFVEVKNAKIEQGAKVNHLTYIGDAQIGAGANIGAGTITCNYDGYDKFFTEIGAEAFIGSNSSLVAPVKIGNGAYVGSGSVVTRDVPAQSLAVSRPQQELRKNWAQEFRDKHED